MIIINEFIKFTFKEKYVGKRSKIRLPTLLTFSVLFLCSMLPELRSETASTFRMIHTPKRVGVAAHRGAGEFAPENTLAAFRKAVELGVDLIEIDVRKTKDGINVIMHDPTLQRTVGLNETVSDLNFADFKDVSAGREFVENVPTLEETCRAVRQ